MFHTSLLSCYGIIMNLVNQTLLFEDQCNCGRSSSKDYKTFRHMLEYGHYPCYGIIMKLFHFILSMCGWARKCLFMEQKFWLWVPSLDTEGRDRVNGITYVHSN